MRQPLCPERNEGNVKRITGISPYPPYPLIFGNHMDKCKISGKICLKEVGSECEVYREYLNKLELLR